jgi:hypothetical protein
MAIHCYGHAAMPHLTGSLFFLVLQRLISERKVSAISGLPFTCKRIVFSPLSGLLEIAIR